MIWRVSLGELIGFGLILITLWTNYLLARRAQKRQWAQEKETREEELKRECHGIRSVLGAELETLRHLMSGGIARMEKMLKAKEKGGWRVNIEARSNDFDRFFMPRIGSLSELEVQHILLAYRLHQECVQNLERLSDPDQESRRHVVVDSSRFNEAIAEKKKVLRSINIAITALKDEGRCRKCGKEASEVSGPTNVMDATRTWQSLCKPCADKLEKSGNLTKAEAAT